MARFLRGALETSYRPIVIISTEGVAVGRAARHKQNLVRTAMRLFRRQGYASTGLQQIVEESGAPKGSLYHYFPSGKEALGEAAVEMAGEMVGSMLSQLAARHREPRAFVRAYCRVMAGWMEESGFRSGCPIATTVLENVPQSPAITAAARRALDGWIEVVGGVFEAAGSERGEARSRAQAIVAAMEGALILSRIRRSTRPILDVAKLVEPAGHAP
jgi:TetR/AcrR family transcriptional repressor of lmrAB and yxaGH operons